jgi:hypothetical protein
LAAGRYVVRWSEVGGPMFAGPTAPPFDPTRISWISFHVVSTTTGAVPYSFCIRNLALLE